MKKEANLNSLFFTGVPIILINFLAIKLATEFNIKTLMTLMGILYFGVQLAGMYILYKIFLRNSYKNIQSYLLIAFVGFIHTLSFILM